MQGKRKRGRPRTHKETKPMSFGVEKLLDGPSYPLELMTTKFGGMKLALLGYCFEFHFNRKGNKFWKCLNHGKGCEARVVSKDLLVYPLDLNHNHEEDAGVKDAVPSTALAQLHNQSGSNDKFTSITEEVAVPEPVKSEPEIAQQLKNKMKQRLAAIGLNVTGLKK